MENPTERMNRVLPLVLLLLYLAEFSYLAIRPYDRGVWVAENAPIVLIVAFLVVTQRWFRFSNTAYVLMSVLVFLHTIGGHYTFERVPFKFVTDLIGAQRNHYDRVAHFSVGFYAFGIAEFIERRQLIRPRQLTGLFAVFSIAAVALGYEVFEWLYALKAEPDAGLAVLGSQGDRWDAQKDMLADTLGAVTSVLLYFAIHRSPPSGEDTP